MWYRNNLVLTLLHFMRWGKWNVSNIFFNLSISHDIQIFKDFAWFRGATLSTMNTTEISITHEMMFLCRNMSSREMDLGNTTNFWLTTSANVMEKWRTVKIHQIIYHVNYSSGELPQEINYVTLFVLLHKISSKLTHGFT